MAILDCCATRMELNKLKTKLAIATNSHKLLKRKKDGLIYEFLKITKEFMELKKNLKNKLKEAELYLELTKAETSRQELKIITLNQNKTAKIKTSVLNIMGIATNQFSLDEDSEEIADIFKEIEFKLVEITPNFNKALLLYKKSLINLIEIASKEKTISILANEIEKTKRKANALEYFIIPNYKDTIRSISFKLEENERSRIARLMNIDLG